MKRRRFKERRMSVEKLSENISGVMHNLKSALMAVNGYLDLLGKDGNGEIYEQAKRSTATVETIIANLVFAVRAYRNTEPGELSLNACVRSAVELLRSNRTFNGKVKFELELGVEDGIYGVPAKVMGRLDTFITDAAMRVLKGKDHVLTVATVCEREHVSVRIGAAEVAFPREDAK